MSELAQQAVILTGAEGARSAFIAYFQSFLFEVEENLQRNYMLQEGNSNFPHFSCDASENPIDFVGFLPQLLACRLRRIACSRDHTNPVFGFPAFLATNPDLIAVILS